MAQSRLEKIGTIFTRVNGLMRSGAMKPNDKPIWYDLYEAFPPKLEPRYDRPAPNLPIKNIFYTEDVARAKFQKSLKHQETVNLLDKKRETQTQQFIKIYENLKSQGALDEEKIFETSFEVLQQQREQMKYDNQDLPALDSVESFKETKLSLSEAFNEAKESRSHQDNLKQKANYKKPGATPSIGGIDIKNLFKD